VQPLGRADEAQLLRDGDEIAELPQVEIVGHLAHPLVIPSEYQLCHEEVLDGASAGERGLTRIHHERFNQ